MGNNSWMDSPFFSRHLVPQNVGNIIFVCYFLNIGLGPKKSMVSPSVRKIKFRDYFIRNRLEKLVPLNWNFAPHNLKNQKKTTNLFSNLDFFGPIWGAPPRIVQGFPMDFPRISHGFPTPPLLEFSGRPRERPTKNKIGCPC